MASTRAGESSLGASDRVSMGSKLKESKISAVSFNSGGFDYSGGNRNDKTPKGNTPGGP